MSNGAPGMRALAHELGRRAAEDGEAPRVVGVVVATLPVDAFAIVEPGHIEEHELDARAEPPVVDGDLDLLLVPSRKTSGVSRRATSRPPRSSGGKRGMARVTLWPSWRSALLSAATTSASPPTLTSGASSVATNRMSIGRPV